MSQNPVFQLVIALMLLCCTTACLSPSPRKYQRIIHGFSVERIDSMGQILSLQNTPRNRYRLKIRVDEYLHLSSCEAFDKDSTVIQYWYWDRFGQLLTYRRFDRQGRRRLGIQVQSPNPAMDYSAAKIPTGDDFMVARFRHDRPWKNRHFEGGHVTAMSKSGKYQLTFYPSGRRQIQLDAEPDDKVRRARLWNEAGKCIADTTFATPQSVTRLRPDVLKFLEKIAQ